MTASVVPLWHGPRANPLFLAPPPLRTFQFGGVESESKGETGTFCSLEMRVNLEWWNVLHLQYWGMSPHTIKRLLAPSIKHLFPVHLCSEKLCCNKSRVPNNHRFTQMSASAKQAFLKGFSSYRASHSEVERLWFVSVTVQVNNLLLRKEGNHACILGLSSALPSKRV